MNVHTIDSLEELQRYLGLSQGGIIRETDLDLETSECDRFQRRRRDAEVLSLLAANSAGNCLDLGTSHGRSAFRMAINISPEFQVFTVNLLPEQYTDAAGRLTTHLLPQDEIGSFFKERGLTNIEQIYADSTTWDIPTRIADLGLVFVDAAHDTECVRQDSLKVFDRIRKGGFLCWHDFCPELRYRFDWIDSAMRGVEWFWTENNLAGEIVHLRNSWIGIYRKEESLKPQSGVKIGLICNREFHEQRRWVSATFPYLLERIIRFFPCHWIQNQKDYEEAVGEIDVLLSMEPGWAAPRIEFKRTASLSEVLKNLTSFIIYSDPHENKWREDYFLCNGIDRVLALYDQPTRYHFKRIPGDRLIHFPWAVPDHWLAIDIHLVRLQRQITLYGAKNHPAYELRNWCRQFSFVDSKPYSGCEHKQLTSEQFAAWLRTQDAVVAAGSDDLRYRLTVPKYFEVPAAGALLFAQETDDLSSLGFEDEVNCIVFNRQNFEDRARAWLTDPDRYLPIRVAGRDFIRERHTISIRIKELEQHINENLKTRTGSVRTACSFYPRTQTNKTLHPDPSVADFDLDGLKQYTFSRSPEPTCIEKSPSTAGSTVYDRTTLSELEPIITDKGLQPSASRLFTSNAELYLASADRIDRVLMNLSELQNTLPLNVDTYATVIGGLSGLNYLLVLKPRHVVFYDINQAAIEYARLMVEMIRLAANHQDFISRIFSRSMREFLAHSGEIDLTCANQEVYLSQPVDKSLLSDTLSRLSPAARLTFEKYVSLFLPGETLDGVRNCRRLLPCWPAAQRVPVGAGAALGHDEFGNLVPNTNTFFYGLGWLASSASFARIKQLLANVDVQYVQFDLLRQDPFGLTDHTDSLILHVSNIDDWFPEEWPNLIAAWEERAFEAQCRLNIISSHNGVWKINADPHKWAYAGLIPHVFGKVVEVTHKVPWGFNEIPRTNVTVEQYLGGEYPADTTILHILVGEGLPQEEFLQVYHKALERSGRVIVLEHNRESADWAPHPPAHYLNEKELCQLLSDRKHASQTQIAIKRKLVGERDSQRNLMIVVDTSIMPNSLGTAALLAQDNPSMRITTANVAPCQLSLSALSSKPRVLLIADVPDWIFARHCDVLSRLLSDRFEFTIQFKGQEIYEDDFDLIYPLEWNLVPKHKIYNPVKYITGIRSHLSWQDLDFLSFIDFLSAHYCCVHTVSKRLYNIFTPFLANLVHVTHGVDTDFFLPRTRADQSGCGRLRIGWAGNRVNVTKGFEKYIAPLAGLPGVELLFCGYQDNNLNLEQMRDFYDSIDVYICSSSIHHEGNNNSLMEAAAMQRAIITTDNGTVPEYLVQNESALIIERELPNFISAVIRLRDNPAQRVALGEKARAAVKQAFHWPDMIEGYAAFFRYALTLRRFWRPDHKASRHIIAPHEASLAP